MQNETWIALTISAGGALATVVMLALKARLNGDDPSESAPMLRQFVAYFAAYLAAFAAAATLERPWSLLAIVFAASVAFAVTMHGDRPLATRAFLRTWTITLAVFVGLWALYEVLLLAGIDLLDKNFEPPRQGAE